MAEGSGTSTLLIVLVIGLLAFFLLNKAQKTASSIGSSVRQVNNTVGTVTSIAQSAAPALGSFFGNLFRGGGGSTSLGSSAPDTSGSAFSSDGLMEPNFSSDSSYTDDSFDFGSD
jgi:hypothetical protein